MLTLIPSRLFQTQLVEDPAGSSKESTSFSLTFSMFHQNFTELEFRKILFHLFLLFFRTSKLKTWKTHKKRMLPKRNTLLLLTKKALLEEGPPPTQFGQCPKGNVTFPLICYLPLSCLSFHHLCCEYETCRCWCWHYDNFDFDVWINSSLKWIVVDIKANWATSRGKINANLKN